jgi:hypothetical protein
MEQFNKGEIDADTTFNMQRQILIDKLMTLSFLNLR